MNQAALVDIAKRLLGDDKGLLAMDESNATCNKRFAEVGVAQTEEARRRYREMILTTEGLGENISGVILYDETIRQARSDGTTFLKLIADTGIVPGVKVDAGAKDLAVHPGEKITEGLDGLSERLQLYYAMGARFAKWRGVIGIGEDRPTDACMGANAHALARYAGLRQEAGMVPIVEPEVLMDGAPPIRLASSAGGCRALTPVRERLRPSDFSTPAFRAQAPTRLAIKASITTFWICRAGGAFGIASFLRSIAQSFSRVC